MIFGGGVNGFRCAKALPLEISKGLWILLREDRQPLCKIFDYMTLPTVYK